MKHFGAISREFAGLLKGIRRTGARSFSLQELMDFQEMRTNALQITGVISALLLHVYYIRRQLLPSTGCLAAHPLPSHVALVALHRI